MRDKQGNLIPPPLQTPYGDENQDPKHSLLQQLTSTTPTGKKPKTQTDQMLQLTNRLDRILREMPADMRVWALSWLSIKYGAKNATHLP